MTKLENDPRGSGRTPIERVRYPDPPASTVQPQPAADGAEVAMAVSGRVGTWDEAAVVTQALYDEGFSPRDIEVFYTGPAGRHAVTPIGGDSHADAGARHAGEGAALGALGGAAVGLAVGAAIASAPVAGPVMLAAAATGAYGGALAGGVAATEDGAATPDTEAHPVAKPGGVVVAVRVDRAEGDDGRALRCLERAGAIALERSPARWRDGQWVDWDPVAPREQIAPQPGTPQA